MTKRFESVPPLDHRERRKRRREIVAIGVLSLLFAALTFAEFRLTRLSSTLPFVNSIFFFGIVNVNLVILIALVWLIFRNIGKVFLERRRKVLGSRLKTKLVTAFFAFSIIPTLVLFLISALYINSSFDKWFSLRIQNTLQASLEITGTYYRNMDANAMHFAEHLAPIVGARLSHQESLASLETYLRGQRELLSLDAVEFYRDPLEPRILTERPQGAGELSRYPVLPLDKLDQAFKGEKVSVLQHIGSGDLIRCLVPVLETVSAANGADRVVSGVMVVSVYIPVSLVNKVDEIASVFDDYKDTNPLKYPIKTTYLVILIMITFVIMVVAVWIALYLARELTVPVERLVHAAHEVGKGNLDVSIVPSGNDELSMLVNSFNEMTLDLKQNREKLTSASADLERRRLQLEVILASVGTGVFAVDQQGLITAFNGAAAKLTHLHVADVVGRGYKELFGGDLAPLSQLLDQLVESKSKPDPETIQFTYQFVSDTDGDAGGPSGPSKNQRVYSAIATPIAAGKRWGVVVVMDDMTHIVKGQRELAWREVARRIAHEIKNPLTPIKLSAQRLQRQLSDRFSDPHAREAQLLKECTDTIIRHTDELKEMVNEFSNFARFPEVSPAPHQLNDAVAEVVSLYRQAHAEIIFETGLELKMPIFDFDRDQIKRVLINLLDNAVAAVQSPLPAGTLRHAAATHKRVSVSTQYNETLQIAVIEVADNGLGMSEEVKARVFEPYFSTKSEGTGLGLAIAKRIVNDHDGFMRVQSAPGEGSRFWIELPTSRRQVSQLRV